MRRGPGGASLRAHCPPRKELAMGIGDKAKDALSSDKGEKARSVGQ